MVQDAFVTLNQVLHRRTGSTIAPETNCSAIWGNDFISDERNSLVCEHVTKFVRNLPYGFSFTLEQNGSLLKFVGKAYKGVKIKEYIIDLTKKVEILSI